MIKSADASLSNHSIILLLKILFACVFQVLATETLGFSASTGLIELRRSVANSSDAGYYNITCTLTQATTGNKVAKRVDGDLYLLYAPITLTSMDPDERELGNPVNVSTTCVIDEMIVFCSSVVNHHFIYKH